MYFFKKKNKIHLFLNGNLILTHNPKPILANLLNVAPKIHFGLFIILPEASKFRASWAALKFIWGPSTAMDHGTPNVPYVKPVEVDQ